MSANPNQFIVDIAKRAADECRAAGVNIHAIEITAWRNAREILARGVALRGGGETATTQEAKHEATR